VIWRANQGQGRPLTPEGRRLLAISRVRDPELIPRGELRTDPRPGGLGPDLWDLCGTGWPAGVDALHREAAGEDDLTAWLDATQEPGDLRHDVERFEDRLDAWRWVRAQLATLPERERLVLTWRSEGATLLECAEMEGITRERVRQIEARALRKMREAQPEVPVRKAGDRRYGERGPVNRYGIRVCYGNGLSTKAPEETRC